MPRSSSRSSCCSRRRTQVARVSWSPGWQAGTLGCRWSTDRLRAAAAAGRRPRLRRRLVVSGRVPAAGRDVDSRRDVFPIHARPPPTHSATTRRCLPNGSTTSRPSPRSCNTGNTSPRKSICWRCREPDIGRRQPALSWVTRSPVWRSDTARFPVRPGVRDSRSGLPARWGQVR